MKNEEIVEELRFAARETLRSHLNFDMGNEAAEKVVRAVLSRLAEIGMSEEMKQAVRDHSSVSTDRAAVAFTVAIRSLAGGE